MNGLRILTFGRTEAVADEMLGSEKKGWRRMNLLVDEQKVNHSGDNDKDHNC
jgi:hypothetical protein